MLYSKIKHKASMDVFDQEALAFFSVAKNARLLILNNDL